MIQAKIDPKYEIVKKLREGGMGAIYLVRHRLLDELRVVKVLRSQLVAEEDLKERFLREAKIAIHLRHPNIAQLYDFSIDDEGTAYIVLEYIDGITLEEYCRQPEARHLTLTLAIAQQGLRALGYLHRKGFVHRDIAPDNLMLTRDVDGEPLVKLIDLGIVKILKGEGKGTATSLYLGKPKYSSPEQLVSQNIDARSDLYSFGVLLYELVTGVYPIPGHDLPSLITGHLHRDPVDFAVSDPGGVVPESLRQVIRAALAKRPEERLPSAEEFSRRLAEVAESLTHGGRREERALLDAAREGARRERLAALDEAERQLRERIERREFGEARQLLSQAVERLGNDTRLAELRRQVDQQERGHRSELAESKRLDRMADEAEQALAEGKLPEAMSKVFEIVAQDPLHTRGRELQERIDRIRRDQEARNAGATQATVVAERSSPDTPGAARTLPPERLVSPAAAAAAADEVTAGISVAAERERIARPAPRRSTLALAGVAAAALGVAIAGWLLFRAMSAPGGNDLPAAPGGGATAGPQTAYAAGMERLAAGDSQAAARELRAAFAGDSTERSGYYPQAAYGLALAALGDCAQAERLFAASEAQQRAPRDPIWSEVVAARGRCAAGTVTTVDGEQFATHLAEVEGKLERLLRQLGELRGLKTQPAVAALWRSRPELARQEKQIADLAAEADRVLAAARARRDLGQVFEAENHTADALSSLKELLTAAAEAAGQARDRAGGN